LCREQEKWANMVKNKYLEAERDEGRILERKMSSK
jgi:hypothetical protein